MAKTVAPSERSRASSTAAWIGRPFRRRQKRADGFPASPRLSPRRAVRFVAIGAAGVVAAIGALWLAIVYLPLPASQILPRVIATLEERLGPDYRVMIADAELRRGGGGVELRLFDLAIARAGGSIVAAAPRVELKIDGFGLIRGEVKVRAARVTRPRLDLSLGADGDALAMKADLPARILAAAADLDRLLGPDGEAGALEEMTVADAAVLVAPRGGASFVLEGVDLKLNRGTAGALALTASSVRSAERWSTAVTVAPGPAGQGRVFNLGLENVDLAPYSTPFAGKAGGPPLAGRLSGHLHAEIGSDGRLLAGDGRIAARAVRLVIPGPAPTSGAASASVGLDDVELNLGWDVGASAMIVEPSRLSGPGGQLTFSGTITAPGKDRPTWVAALQGREALLAGEGAGDPPLRLDQIVVEATFDAAAGLIEVGRAQLVGPTVKAAATALIRFEGATPAIRLGLASEPMPASAMKRLWPPFIAPPVRAWAVENIASGTVDGLSLSLDVPAKFTATMKADEPLPPGSMALDVAFSNAVMRGMPGLPWIEGVAGRVEATARRVTAAASQGQVRQTAAAPGALTVSNIRFDIADIAVRYPKASVSLKAVGALDPALALVASGVIGANLLPPQLDPSKVSGRIAADVAVGFELGHENAAGAPAAEVRASAEMTDVTVANVFAGRSFEKGAFRLATNAGRAELTGKGRIGGAPATVTLIDAPATANTPRARRLTATLTVEAADLARLGFDVPGALTGALPLEASLALDEPGAPVALTADLTAVGVDGVVPGFRKAAGRPGRLSLLVDRRAEKTTVRDFALESGERSVRGTLEFGPKGELLAAKLPIYRPSPGDDARVEIDKTRSGLVQVAVQGAALDLKPLLDVFRGKTPAGGGRGRADSPTTMPKSLDLSAKLGTGLGYGGQAMAGLDLRIVMRDGKVTDADGTGRLGSGAIKLATAEDGRLKLTGDDAGAFFRLADLYARIDGGVFDLSAALTGGAGLLRVRDFSVRNEDALERVRQTTSADRTASTSPARGATRFDRLRVAFVEGGGRIEVKEASVTGPTLGATLEGVVDYASDRVALVGTFVPAYALNNLVSRVPIIGALLGGGEHGGLVGVTFQVKGPTTSPTVTINPISAVAPGFLRKLFEFRQSGADATSSVPTNAPPAQ